ncbi:hypothetical protein [Streptomyces sp. NPDC046942]|uniref:WXG100 family type VII secretion target n=1 Tax=Streptomyces sp. NPDC046942 TaxID=3155137 RepID=UPI0033D23D9B
MSDNWQKDPTYKSGLQQAKLESGGADVLAAMENLFRATPFGRTQFDDRDLNEMIDLVEHANPEHLEMAGKAMWDARDAIKTAAQDLSTYVDQAKADWHGEGATAFKNYANSLLDWAKEFEDYAHGVGTQITTAATGLASVRKAMPPRDPRPEGEQKRPWLLPKAKQVASNPDYVLAQKVEKNRQEAINQMNRLGSYYSVAAWAMKEQPKPSVKTIDQIPDFGVPLYHGRDEQRRAYSPEKSTPAPTPTAAIRPSVVEGHGAAPGAHGTEPGGGVPPLKEVPAPTGHPGHDVGTEINTVGTLPPPPHAAQPGPSAPTVPTTGGGPTPPVTTGPMAPPVTPTAGRTTGYGPAGRLPISAQGRTGPSGTARGQVPQEPEGQTSRSVPGGRVPQGPMGQAARAMGRTTAPAGESAVRGSTQRAGRSPLGRGITGGTPRMTSAPGERAGTTGPIGAVRNGVVGGKPAEGRTPGSTANPRVPRGMVVGAEEPVSSAQPPKGAVGQRGVIGAPVAKADPGASQSVLRSASNPEGVIGAPRNAAGSPLGGSETGARSAGLGRGAVDNRQGAKGETDREGGAAENQQHRRPQKQRRDAPQKRD